jgi:hypothetical protein
MNEDGVPCDKARQLVRPSQESSTGFFERLLVVADRLIGPDDYVPPFMVVERPVWLISDRLDLAGRSLKVKGDDSIEKRRKRVPFANGRFSELLHSPTSDVRADPTSAITRVALGITPVGKLVILDTDSVGRLQGSYTYWLSFEASEPAPHDLFDVGKLGPQDRTRYIGKLTGMLEETSGYYRELAWDPAERPYLMSPS